MQWKYPSSYSTKTSKVTRTPSAGKVILTVFWDYQEVLLTYFQKLGGNVKCASYCEVLLDLRDKVRGKPPGQLTRGLLLHYNSARPHIARETQERLQELQCELLEHPPYSMELASSNFHLFGLLKTTLVANVSLMTKRLKLRCEWVREQSEDSYAAAAFDILVKRWNKFINIGRGYVEK
jgi:histone-lysine N-methyltransferase SETMAR